MPSRESNRARRLGHFDRVEPIAGFARSPYISQTAVTTSAFFLLNLGTQKLKSLQTDNTGNAILA
jgi:hypothetical protein